MQTNEILQIENSIYINIRFEIFGWICMYVYIDRIWRWITNKVWYPIKSNQPTNQPTNQPNKTSKQTKKTNEHIYLMGWMSCWLECSFYALNGASKFSLEYYNWERKNELNAYLELTWAFSSFFFFFIREVFHIRVPFSSLSIGNISAFPFLSLVAYPQCFFLIRVGGWLTCLLLPNQN